MSTTKTYFLLVPVLQHGPWYLKRGDTVPEGVPAELIAAWLKAKHIGETAPEGAETVKRQTAK